MRLSPEAFNAFIGGMGQQVAWRRAHDCPCRDPHSGAADYQCPNCDGKGVVWEAAVDGYVAITGQKVLHNWAKLGEYESGDQVMTIPSDSPLYAMGQYDRITMQQSSIPFSQVFTHGGADRLPFNAESIHRVFWLGADSAQVDGGLPVIDTDGRMTWLSDEPPIGAQYTITGRRRPEYFIYTELPQDRAHHGGQSLPRRVVARRMDLFGRR